MPGNRPNPEFFSGIPSSKNRFLTVMPIRVIAQCQQTHAAKFRFALTTVAVCWQLIYIRMSKIHLRRKPNLILTLFKEHVHYAQRIMDDIIDLELEKIDAILEKVNADPEGDEIKFVERNLWENIKKKANEGRRTGIGITAEGDMLAALGLQYGSDIATDFSEEIHKTVAIESYRSSVYLAKDQGPVYHLQHRKGKRQSVYQPPQKCRSFVV